MKTGMKGQRYLAAAAAFLVTAALAPAESRADAYIGGSLGQSAVAVEVSDQIQTFAFDEEDFAWKAFVGYEFPLPLLSLGIEAGYVDFGAPSGDVLGSQLEVDVDGFSAFGMLGVDIGPVGVFAKYGVISWDASVSVDGVGVGSDDGSDPAYGVGAKIGLGSLDIRAEYEIFDVEDSDDVTMLSVGLAWSF